VSNNLLGEVGREAGMNIYWTSFKDHIFWFDFCVPLLCPFCKCILQNNKPAALEKEEFSGEETVFYSFPEADELWQ
jgi:hypothetical protein